MRAAKHAWNPKRKVKATSSEQDAAKGASSSSGYALGSSGTLVKTQPLKPKPVTIAPPVHKLRLPTTPKRKSKKKTAAAEADEEITIDPTAPWNRIDRKSGIVKAAAKHLRSAQSSTSYDDAQ